MHFRCDVCGRRLKDSADVRANDDPLCGPCQQQQDDRDNAVEPESWDDRGYPKSSY